MKKRIGINGTIIFLAVVASVVFWRQVMRPAGLSLGRVLEPAGLFLLLTGVLLRVASRGYKSEHSAGGHALVQGGPYELVRNPMYLGIFCCGLGAVLMFLRLWVVLVFLAFMVVRYLTLIRKEEAILTERFGKPYTHYLSRVPRLIPAWKTLCTGNAAALLPLKTKWIRMEFSSLLFLLPGICLIEFWRAKYFLLGPWRDQTLAALAAVLVTYFVFLVLLIRAYEKASTRNRNSV